jgi:hypothetical protein
MTITNLRQSRALVYQISLRGCFVEWNSMVFKLALIVEATIVKVKESYQSQITSNPTFLLDIQTCTLKTVERLKQYTIYIITPLF